MFHVRHMIPLDMRGHQASDACCMLAFFQLIIGIGTLLLSLPSAGRTRRAPILKVQVS
jgi:hypothetical protein